MPNIDNIDLYNSILKSKVTQLAIIAIVLCIIFIAIIVYSIIQIKEDKTKKFPYFQLIAMIVIFIFLGISLGSQIMSFTKDINEEAYILYEGPAAVREKRQVILGGRLPTAYTEYIISFEQDGEQLELSTRKNYGFDNNVEKIYIVYSKHSNYILEIKE